MEERSVVGVGVVLLVMPRTPVVGVLSSPAQASRETNVAVTNPSTGTQANWANVESRAQSQSEGGNTAVNTSTAVDGAQVEGTIQTQSS